jgi:predicted DCC family thiol-disulfide oxidoreductase YuxK
MSSAERTSVAIRYPLTIYYDSACPICSTEMGTLMSLDVDHRLVLFDGAGGALDAACIEAGLSSQQLLAIIHARDADGRWIEGIDVFVAAYRAAGLSALASLFADRRLRPIWDRVYPWIARNRYRLSRLGLHHLFRLIPHRRLLASAERAVRTSATCTNGSCKLGSPKM